MKALLILTLFTAQSVWASPTWTEFSKRKVSTGTADFTKALTCRFSRTFTGDYVTEVMLRVSELNPNSQSMWDVMMKSEHHPSIHEKGKRQDLCDLVNELHQIRYGELQTDNIVLTDGSVIKEFITFTFSNGLEFKSEAEYKVRK